MHREDFEILNTGIIYLDNGATTLKPKCVVDATVDYYTKYTANAHRGDYDNSLKVDMLYEGVRDKVRDFIHAKSSKEIIFTSGTTDSLNRIVFGFMKTHLKKGDEVLLTKAEHASNILPWLELEKDVGVVVKYIPLENHQVVLKNVLETITDKTKVISLAHVTNVLGDERPIREIGCLCQEKGIYFVVDGAQSVSHRPVDVEDLHLDFLAFSAHKMLGPTGVGVLYGKEELLEELHPTIVGGGMNATFSSEGSWEYKSLPSRLEAGTPNIAGVIGFGAALDYLMKIGMENIYQYECSLKKYFISQLETIDNVIVYNKEVGGSTVAFNIDDVFSQDTAIYLNHYHVCVRAGNHCAKILKEDLQVKNTCRASLYFYNTKEEIDSVIQVLRQSKDIFRIVL